MLIADSLPKTLEELLFAENGGKDNIVAIARADVMPGGAFGEQWVVVTAEKLRVYEPPNGEGRPHVRAEYPLGTLKAPRADSLIGGGALLADVDGTPIEIARYTNVEQRAFSKVAKFLDDTVKYREAQEKGEETEEAPRLEEDNEEEQRKRCARCGLLLPEGTTVCPACMNKGRVLLRLGTYLRPYRAQTALLCTLLLASSGLGLIAPYLTRPLMDVVLVPQGTPRAESVRMSWLVWIVLGMLASQIVREGLNILQGRTAAVLTHRLAHDLRIQLYSHLQMLSLRYFDKRQVGSILARVTQDTHEVESVLTIGAQFFLANILTLIGISIILLWLDWRLFLVAVIPAPIVAWLSRIFWQKINITWPRWWHYRGRLSAVINDNLTGVRVVKAFAQERREIERFNPRSAELAQAGMTAERTWMTVFPILTLVTGTGILFVWLWGGQQVVSGRISLGTLMTFVAYLGMFYGPLQFLNRTGEWLSRALASAERVFDILDSEPDVDEADDAVALPRIDGRVQFENITFGYDSHKPVLKNIDLDVAAGEMIGIVGHSGAGKSTTINLLCRFYDVNDGRILVDGVDIRRIRQEDLRSQIGVVLQDTFLFNGTILENIAYARPDAAREDVIAAARAANAHDFICGKPDGYDSVVGERGQSLSGGERQRISIARAILHNPRILILDEATSAVDTDTEKQIQDAIARLIKGRTTFAIAHRLSTLKNADRLMVLKGGKVEEIGTHEELLAKEGGEFRRLVEMQQEMSKIKAEAAIVEG